MVRPTPSPQVYGLYGTAKLDPDNAPRFSTLKGSRYEPGRLAGEKILICLTPDFGARLKPVLPLRAIVIPRIAGRSRPALAALAPSTLFQLPGPRDAVFATVAELVRRGPAYVLELGPDMSAVPSLIGEVVA